MKPPFSVPRSVRSSIHHPLRGLHVASANGVEVCGVAVPCHWIQPSSHYPFRLHLLGRDCLHLHKRVAVPQAILDVEGTARCDPVLLVVAPERCRACISHRLADDCIADEGRLSDTCADNPHPLADVGIEAAGRSRLDGLLTPEDLAGEVLGGVVDVDAHHLNHLFTLSTIPGVTTMRSSTASAMPRPTPSAISRIIPLDPSPIVGPSLESLRC